MPTRRTALALTAAMLLLPLPVRAGDADAAREVVQQLLRDARHSLNGCCPEAALTDAVEVAFDFDIWEKFLLQKRGEAFSQDERAQFRNLLPGFLAHLYRQSFDKGMAAAPTVGDTRKARRDIMVSSHFSRDKGGPLPVDWRLRNIGGQMRVIDIMVGGTSFLLLKRDEFNAIIDTGGAAALLSHMRENAL
ncbi:MAG: ABC transporter substrate-binding protein [Pseudomonadota bacterium]